MKIELLVEKPIVKELADGGFQLKVDTGEYSTQAVQAILGLPKGVYKLTLEPDVSQD